MKKQLLVGIAAGVLAVVAAGCSQEQAGTQEATQEAAAPVPEGPVRYEIAVDTEGFTPATVQARKGEPVTLVFTRVTHATCGNEVVVPAHDIEVKLPLEEPVEITLIPEESGEITFGCGMDMMLMGKVVVN
jgi:plastocyanin domain-containing protein